MIADFIQIFRAMGSAINAVWFIVLPVAFYILFRKLWEDYIINRYLKGIKFMLLEITPPREVEKSPKIAESVFEALKAVAGSRTIFDELIKGDILLASFSFEIVSIEGKIHFFIHLRRNWRNLIESAFYAKYPDVEIKEVSDYTLDVPRIVPNREWNLWGTDFEFAKPDPIPIRIYRQFEETITGSMIDPLASLLESMGRVGPGQQMWFQLIVRPMADISKSWVKPGKAEVDKILDRAKEKGSVLADLKKDLSDVVSNIPKAISGSEIEFEEAKKEKKEGKTMIQLTPGEQEIVKAIEENIGKLGFEVKVRFINIAKRDVFDGAHTGSLFAMLNQFNDLNLNEFKPNDRSKTYAWFFLKNSRLAYRQRKIFIRYRKRDMDDKKVGMSSAELATMYHMPDMSVMAPALPRIEAKKGGAPANLPI